MNKDFEKQMKKQKRFKRIVFFVIFLYIFITLLAAVKIVAKADETSEDYNGLYSVYPDNLPAGCTNIYHIVEGQMPNFWGVFQKYQAKHILKFEILYPAYINDDGTYQYASLYCDDWLIMPIGNNYGFIDSRNGNYYLSFIPSSEGQTNYMYLKDGGFEAFHISDCYLLVYMNTSFPSVGWDKFFLPYSLQVDKNIVTDHYSYLAFEDGVSAGIAVGELNAYELSETWYEAVLAIFDAPVHVFKSIFNFNIFGINIFGFVTGIITLLIVIWLIKKLVVKG